MAAEAAHEPAAVSVTAPSQPVAPSAGACIMLGRRKGLGAHGGKYRNPVPSYTKLGFVRGQRKVPR
jgi:hypothetical protein